MIGTQSRAVGAHWCERKCLQIGEKINNEIWTKCHLPEQLSFGTLASGYKVVVSMNDDVSTLTGEQDVTESLRDLCRQARLSGLEREAMMTIVGQAWDDGDLISSALQL